VATAVITADELRRKLDAGDDFVLVDALAPMVYAHSHLPGAINLPPSAVAPTRLARRRAGPSASGGGRTEPQVMGSDNLI
jgi:3-mercaptopyruvate sulfurtransferase SseA